jgi:hypothetical protein
MDGVLGRRAIQLANIQTLYQYSVFKSLCDPIFALVTNTRIIVIETNKYARIGLPLLIDHV